MGQITKTDTGYTAEVNVMGTIKSMQFIYRRDATLWLRTTERELRYAHEVEEKIKSAVERHQKNFGIADQEIDLGMILKNSIPNMGIPAVYILLYEAKVVYVGQSKNALSRIAEHQKKGRKFDRYTIIPCRIEELDSLERKYIKALDPASNKTHRNDTHGIEAYTF